MFTSQKAAYLDATLQTASPARLLVMLVDRLVLDVRRAEDALANGQIAEVNSQLTHAQDIIMELRTSLDTRAFRGGELLAALYDFTHRRLVEANLKKDAQLIDECLLLTSEIAETWRAAALAAAAAESV